MTTEPSKITVSGEDGVLVERHVGDGALVNQGDVLATIESDKAVLEVTADEAGLIRWLIENEPGRLLNSQEPIAEIFSTKESVASDSDEGLIYFLKNFEYQTRIDFEDPKMSQAPEEIYLNKLKTIITDAVDPKFKDVRQDIAVVKEDIAVVKADISGVNNYVLGVQKSVSDVQNEVLALRTNIIPALEAIKKKLGI